MYVINTKGLKFEIQEGLKGKAYIEVFYLYDVRFSIKITLCVISILYFIIRQFARRTFQNNY